MLGLVPRHNKQQNGTIEAKGGDGEEIGEVGEDRGDGEEMGRWGRR